MQFPNAQKNLMRATLVISILLMLLKFGAYWLTNSTAILTDASESIINVLAGIFALFSIRFASLPRDSSHPYGHGKIEFLSAGVEGILILVAALLMSIKAVYGLIWVQAIEQIDIGIYLTLISTLVNGAMGYYLVQLGKQQYSLTMRANGEHLLTDAYSSVGLLVGLGLMWFTQWLWIDSILALFFSVMIAMTGYQLVRKFIAGILDEADEQYLQQIVATLERHRQTAWIDIHNLRLIQYGNSWHIDCHLTLPFYWTLEQSHAEVKKIEHLVTKELTAHKVEIFVHTDPCLPTSCAICTLSTCPVRKEPLKAVVAWEVKNIVQNQKHTN